MSWGGQQQTVYGTPSCALSDKIDMLNIQCQVFSEFSVFWKQNCFLFFFAFYHFTIAENSYFKKKKAIKNTGVVAFCVIFINSFNTCGKEQWDLHSKASACISWHTLVNVSSEMLSESVKKCMKQPVKLSQMRQIA